MIIGSLTRSVCCTSSKSSQDRWLQPQGRVWSRSPPQPEKWNPARGEQGSSGQWKEPRSTWKGSCTAACSGASGVSLQKPLAGGAPPGRSSGRAACRTPLTPLGVYKVDPQRKGRERLLASRERGGKGSCTLPLEILLVCLRVWGVKDPHLSPFKILTVYLHGSSLASFSKVLRNFLPMGHLITDRERKRLISEEKQIQICNTERTGTM